MEKRSPVAVLLLPFVTFGIYGLLWFYKTKVEMVAKGAEIPSFILAFIPIVNLYWIWKYCEGVATVTDNKTSGATAFIMLLFLGPIGSAIIQSSFNNIE